jgi:hypothetical protein
MSLLTNKDDHLETPKLFLLDDKGNIRTWQGFIEGNVWYSVSGVDGGKQTVSAKKVITSGKNLGKKNETTPEQQTEIIVVSEYNKKIKKGYKDKIVDINGPSEMPFPMALHNIANNWKKVSFPLYIQPKYDGALFIVSLEEFFGYTRGRKQYTGQEHIIKQIKQHIPKTGGRFLVGELWKVGYNLQNISGASRKLLDSDNIKLEYWVFDIFDINNPAIFSDRIVWLDEIFSSLSDSQYIKRAPTSLINTKKEAELIYKSYLSDGYEGAVVRLPTSKYEWGFNKEKRVFHAMKWKPRFDSEFEIFDITDGDGKESGAVIFVLITSKRLTFNSTPNWGYDIRREVYNKLISKKELVIGKLATVEYSAISESGVPQQPKVVNFKDPNLLKLILNI